jgi:IS5 family transposase
VLFRALLRRSLYGLSAPVPEDAFGDWLSIKRFVGLSLEYAVPDQTVLNQNQLSLMEKLYPD